MTCREAMVEIWEMIGEPGDLTPYTDPDDTSTFSMTLPGSVTLLRAVNNGVKAIATYKDLVSGRHYRFRDCMAERYIASSTTTGTADATSSTTSVVLATAESATNTLRGALISCNGEERVIVTNTTTAVTPHKAFTSTTASQSYTIYKRWLDLSSEDDELYEVLKVWDLEDEQEVSRREAGSLAESTITEYGVPTEWSSTGGRIWFDYHVEDSRYYKVDFYKLPAELESTDESTDLGLPDPFHYAVVLWCCGWGFGRYQDPEMRYSYRRELPEFMRTTATEFDVTSSGGREAFGRVVGGAEEV